MATEQSLQPFTQDEYDLAARLVTENPSINLLALIMASIDIATHTTSIPKISKFLEQVTCEFIEEFEEHDECDLENCDTCETKTCEEISEDFGYEVPQYLN